MFSWMNTPKRLSTMILILFLASCGNPAVPAPVRVTATSTPTRTATSTLTATRTATSTLTPISDLCSSARWQGKIRILSTDVFEALQPGGPSVFDRILAQQNPAWSAFRQDVHGEMRSAGVIFHETAFGPELGTGVNPAVLLVTYGVDRNWEPPSSGDLVSEVDHLRAVLRQYHRAWGFGQVDRSQYPQLDNAATYALYRYFDGDISSLEAWCRTYIQVYGVSPVK